MLPGWQNSGPSHWQSRWESEYGYVRVEQHDWLRPRRGDWTARLEEVLLAHCASSGRPVDAGVVLAAHGLGCHLVAAWAAHSRNTRLVRGALLVAADDPQREELAGLLPGWTPAVLQALPFRSQLLHCRSDVYCSVARAQVFAAAWGAEFIEYPQGGHFGADSNLGIWPDGHARLIALCNAVGCDGFIGTAWARS